MKKIVVIISMWLAICGSIISVHAQHSYSLQQGGENYNYTIDSKMYHFQLVKDELSLDGVLIANNVVEIAFYEDYIFYVDKLKDVYYMKIDDATVNLFSHHFDYFVYDIDGVISSIYCDHIPKKPSVGGISILIDGEPVFFDQEPININDRVLVPMRGIFETLEAEVEWDGKDSSITAISGGSTVRMRINDSNYYIDGMKKSMDVPAQLVNSRTMVPIRVIAESLGCEVSWDDAKKAVIINASKSDFEDAGIEYCVRYILGDIENKNNGTSYNGIYHGRLTDEKLSLITSLSVVPDNYYSDGSISLPENLSISTLNDIDKLPNLKSIAVEDFGDINLDISALTHKREWENVNLCDVSVNDVSVLQEINVTHHITFPQYKNYDLFVSEDLNGTGYSSEVVSYNDAKEEYFGTIDAIDEIIDDCKRNCKTDYEKFKYLHDILCDKMDYDYDFVMSHEDKNWIYLSLVLNKGICSVYSSTYKFLCDLLGLECVEVYGDANGIIYESDQPSWMEHSWNIVNLEGEYYHIDVTWDDPIGEDVVIYDYFLLSDKELMALNDHSWDAGEYPACWHSYNND